MMDEAANQGPMHLATSVSSWGSTRRCHRPWHRRALPPFSRALAPADAPAIATVRRDAARGAAGLVESIHDFDPLNLLPMPGASRWAREEVHRPVRKFAEAPSEGPAESVGRF